MTKNLLVSMLLATSLTFANAGVCDDYFKKVEDQIATLEKSGLDKAKLDSVKEQSDAAKKMVEALEKEQQEDACKAGLDVMEQAKERLSQ